MVKPPPSRLDQPEPKSLLRKLLRKPPPVQQHAVRKKESFLKGFLQYLSSDSYMYGPLLSQPAPKSAPPSPPPDSVDLFGGATPLTPSSNIRASNLSSLQSPAAPTSFDLLLSNSTLFHSSSLKDVLTDQDDDSDFLKKDDDSVRSWSATDSLFLLDDFVPLQKETAEEVARRLVRKMGGRYSKELGMYVDFRDNEVERWFLATTLLDPSNLESSKHVVKKLQNLGISKVLDVLSVEQKELEEIFEDTDYTPRMALRLQKVASALQKEHRGGICTLKHIAEYSELKRELESLPGYSRTATGLFLRELRGVWPAANPEIDARTKKAARHLHLVSSSVVRNVSEITPFLLNLAAEAGLDVRDLELALLKLSIQHARQYKQCPGGNECELLSAPLGFESAMKDGVLGSLIV